MKKTNPVSILLLSILFTVVTVGSSIEAVPTPSSQGKFSRCLSAKGHTLTDNKKSEGGEKCCYPRNKKTGKKTCIKCTYPSGGPPAVCTKNQFSIKDTLGKPIVSPGTTPGKLAPPKPLTRLDKLKRGRLNPGRAPSQLAPPGAPATTPAQRARGRYMGRQGFAPWVE